MKHQSSAGVCFLWSAIFIAVAIGGFIFNTRQVEEGALKVPIEVTGSFESANCSNRKGRSEMRVSYSYSAAITGAKPQKHLATYLVGMANNSDCKKALANAAQSYLTQSFYYEASDPRKNTTSLRKPSSFPILLWGLFLASLPAALGLWQLQAKPKKKRKH